MKRPLWMHQIVEYILGAALLSMAVQSESPVVPAAFGVLVMVNASTVSGPLSAFRSIPRAVHRVADFVIAAAMVIVGLVFASRLDSASVIALVGAGALIVFVTLRTDFSERVKSAAPPEGRSESFGRAAGRLAAGGVKVYRRRRGG